MDNGFEERRQGDQRGTGWRPVPDPTRLTTEQLHREIGILHDRFVIRLETMDDLIDEKFRGVEKEFALVERQRVEQKADAKEALAAALQAAEKAVAEQTAAARKDIDALGGRFDISINAQHEAIRNLSDRITVIEAIKIGTTETKQVISNQLGLIIGGGGLVLSIILVAGDVLTK